MANDTVFEYWSVDGKGSLLVTTTANGGISVRAIYSGEGAEIELDAGAANWLAESLSELDPPAPAPLTQEQLAGIEEWKAKTAAFREKNNRLGALVDAAAQAERDGVKD